ncbi:MAG: septum formation initiator family protein [Candidatus Omnitrophica bacterium]|nr:septum formation initiator family protein [Candidatus Omnitrophota bacterium]
MIKNALWLFGFAILALYIFLPSYTKLQDLRQKNVEYSDKIEALKLRKIKMLEEKRRLEEDPIYLEKVGREKMGLIRNGEVVYRINQPANSEKR